MQRLWSRPFGLLAYALFSSETTRRGMDPADYIVSVQVYLAALVACILPLAAALAEKQKLYETASEALGDAQAAWGSLIAAEAHYRLIADNAGDMVMRVGLDGHIIFASPACRLIREDVAEPGRRRPHRSFPPRRYVPRKPGHARFHRKGVRSTSHTPSPCG